MDNLGINWQFLGFCVHSFLIVGGFCLIKFNDFKHLTSDVKELSEEVRRNIALTNKLDKKVAVNTKAINTLEKSKK